MFLIDSASVLPAAVTGADSTAAPVAATAAAVFPVGVAAAVFAAVVLLFIYFES